MNSGRFARFSPPLLRSINLALGLLMVFGFALHTGAGKPSAVYLPFASSTIGLTVTPVGQDINTPTSITHAGDERIFVVERGGRIQILHPDGRETTYLNIDDLVDSTRGELGLFDMAFHPGYADPVSQGFGQFFVSYTGYYQQQLTTFISRFRVSADPDQADPASETWIVREPQQDVWHKGGDLAFDSGNHILYVSFGDDATSLNAQWPKSLKGKIVRFDVDSVPPAAVGDATGLVEIQLVAMGLRNPWRFHLDPENHRLFVADVGENLWEEVNVVHLDRPLSNLGWPCWEGPEVYAPFTNSKLCQDATVFTPPVVYHSHLDGHCAIIGGKILPSAGKSAADRYIYSDTCSKTVFAMSQTGSDWHSYQLGTLDLPGLLTTIGDDIHGNLYIGITTASGSIYRLNFHQ